MDFLERVSSADLTQYEQLQKVKEVFESDDWEEYRDDATQELSKRKELNEKLNQLREETRKATKLLWQDPLISFARDIHYNVSLRDLDDAQIDAEAQNRKKIKSCGRTLGLIGGFLIAGGVALTSFGAGDLFEIGLAITLLGGIMELAMWIAGLIAEGEMSLAKLKDIASAMMLVKKTEQYKAILELESFERIIEREIKLCSWPPVKYHSPQAWA